MTYDYLDLLPAELPDFTVWHTDRLLDYQDEIFTYLAQPQEIWFRDWLNTRLAAIDDQLDERFEMQTIKPLKDDFEKLVRYLDDSLDIEAGIRDAMERHPSGKKRKEQP